MRLKRKIRRVSMVLPNGAMWEWPCEAGVVHLCSRQLCDPHLHHGWVGRMGPWRLASGVWHAAALMNAPGMRVRSLLDRGRLILRFLVFTCSRLVAVALC